MTETGHTWNYYSSTMVQCPWCGQVRQSMDGERYWVVTFGMREPAQTYADRLAGRVPERPDPEICVERRIVASAPLQKTGAL